MLEAEAELPVLINLSFMLSCRRAVTVLLRRRTRRCAAQMANLILKWNND